jgi:hypothetical protein
MTKEEAATFWQRPHHRIMRSKKAYNRQKEKGAGKQIAFSSYFF